MALTNIKTSGIADDAVGAEHIEQLDAALQFGDSVKAQFGAGNDLELYHDGTDTHIDNATSNLRIKSNDIQLRDNAENFYIDCNNGGSVDLYYNGSKRIETDANGTKLIGNGSAAELEIRHDASTYKGSIYSNNLGVGLLDSTGNWAIQHASGTATTFSISNASKATINTHGLCFGSDTAAANALDDYEEGTFSPIPTGASTTFTYAYNNGWYQKVGNTVTFQIYLMFYASSIVSGNGGNPVSITGLPFTIKNHDRYVPAFTVGRTYNFDLDSDKRVYAYGDNNTTNIRLMVESDDTTGASLTVQQVDQSTCLTFISGTYQV